MRLTHHQRKERPIYLDIRTPFDDALHIHDWRDRDKPAVVDLDHDDDTILAVLRALRDRRTDLYDHVFGEPYDGSQRFGTNTIKARLDFTASSRPPGDGKQ